MPAIDQALAGATRVVAGAILQARQPSDSTALPMTTDTSIPTPSPPPPSATQPGNQGNSGTNSPLLFFVALGFGVVFTNLWIIVGVKYCFRYNSRNRRLRLNEDGEPINMENIPRPHRRRREKKLMTMDEVNEKFPMQKYKNWVASRAKEGLPTTGGVSRPTSRANSIREAEGVSPELQAKERESTEEHPTADATTDEKTEDGAAATVGREEAGQTSGGDAPKADGQAKQRADSNDDDAAEDDDHINAALPPECLGTAGDTCAICIDALENDDDVRGLTCGHAFHAGCLDPWLTSRRACCPLCKADYYTPKPRANNGNNSSGNNNGNSNGNNNNNDPNYQPPVDLDTTTAAAIAVTPTFPSGAHARRSSDGSQAAQPPSPRPRAALFGLINGGGQPRSGRAAAAGDDHVHDTRQGGTWMRQWRQRPPQQPGQQGQRVREQRTAAQAQPWHARLRFLGSRPAQNGGSNDQGGGTVPAASGADGPGPAPATPAQLESGTAARQL